MNQPQTEKAPLAAAVEKRGKPDVVVAHANQTTLFKPQNQRVAEWLHRRCGLTIENITGETEILVHPRRCQSIIAELKAVGFAVAGEREKLC